MISLNNIDRGLINDLYAYTTQKYVVPKMCWDNIQWLTYEMRCSDAKQVTILGRATMIEQVMDLIITHGGQDGFLPCLSEDLIREGHLGMYRGCAVRLVATSRDDKGVFLPANVMFLVGDTVPGDESQDPTFTPYIIQYVDNLVTP